MAKKTDMSKIFEKYGPMLKKFGDEVGEVAKKGEEGVIKMSKLAKIQLDILGVSLQKEKLYYELGKEVAGKILKDDFNLSGMEKYKKQLSKIKLEGEKMKNNFSKVSKSGKKKTVAKKS
ncbi:MAG: hypothetical protein ABID83_02450 [Candidatus Omnitrophota bacterium]